MNDTRKRGKNVEKTEQTELVQEEPRFTVAEFMAKVKELPQEERLEMGKLLGVSTPVGQPAKRRKNKTTNEDVRRMSLMSGGVTHDEDFRPQPPEWVAEKGPEFVEAWMQAWEDGKQSSISEHMSERDYEDLRLSAGANTPGLIPV